MHKNLQKIVLLCGLIIFPSLGFGQIFDYFEEFDSQPKVFDATVKWQEFDLNLDETVFIDLKRDEIADTDGALSKNVDKVIRRELETSKISLKSAAPKRISKREVSLDAFSTYEFTCLGESNEKAKEFDFIPSYDENEVISAVKGRLERKVGERLLGSILGGTCLPVNINESNEEPHYSHIISLTKEKIAALSDDAAASSESEKRDVGHLLVKFSSKVERVGVDRTYEGMKYLNENFAVVQDIAEAEYALFLGVSAGNVLLSIYGDFGETELVAHVFLSEITFENIEIDPGEDFQVNIFKKDLLATTPLEIDLPEENIRAFNHPRSHSVKLSNSIYEIKNATYPNGARHYLEISYLEDTLMVGLEKAKMIEIPSPNLYKMILDETGVTSLKHSCVIQLNLRSPCSELKARGYSELSQEGLEQFYLDSDGKITNELSELTEKIFLVGSFSGIIDFSIENLRKEKMMFRTFCAENVYLVEQL